MSPSQALHNWLPVRLQKASPDLLCEWLHIGEKEFTEPFFEETLSACKYAQGGNRRYKSVSGLPMLAEWSKEIPALAPTAIIFHVSRCGSTLLSQLLSLEKKNLVLSEVPFFDDILRLPFQFPSVSQPAASNFFRAALVFYGRQRNSEQKNLFVKTDSWHLHFYEQLRTLFPQIPFILLYRDPFDVLHSQQKQRGLQSVPGLIEPQLFGFTDEESRERNPDRYMAHVLSSYFRQISTIIENDPLAFAFDYAEGMNHITKEVYRLLQLPLSSSLEQQFEERCRYHGKRPQQVFAETREKSKGPGYLEPCYALYEKLRKSPAGIQRR